MAKTASLVDAAQRMRAAAIGDVVVLDGNQVRGIVTDRDIVVRGIADGRDTALDHARGDLQSRPDHRIPRRPDRNSRPPAEGASHPAPASREGRPGGGHSLDR
jgi:hypothetical protein